MHGQQNLKYPTNFYIKFCANREDNIAQSKFYALL